MNRQQSPPSSEPAAELVCGNQFGTFFGVSQTTFDRVWKQITAPEGNSVAYVSMEIGADPDVFHPVRNYLLSHQVTTSKQAPLNQLLERYLNGPRKIPNYSGGLGVLAGDTLKSFADMHLPVVGVSLLYRGGYFSQVVDSKVGQIDHATSWTPEATPTLFRLHQPDHPEEPLEIEIPFFNGGQQPLLCKAQVWMKMEIAEGLDYFTPEFLLDYNLADAPQWVGEAAQQLYNAKSDYVKANQRRMLGSSVLPLLSALGISSQTIHLNEQHGVTATLHLILQELATTLGENYAELMTDRDILAAASRVSQKIVYTIHTPVKAGHDRFSREMYSSISHAAFQRILNLVAHDDEHHHEYNFTAMAMRLNRSINSVSRLHRDVTRKQFPAFTDKIKAITNGVHHLTWISDQRAELFDRIPSLKSWRENPGCFSSLAIDDYPELTSGLKEAWQQDNLRLIEYTNQMLDRHRAQMSETWIDPPNYLSRLSAPTRLEAEVFTIGFARRFSTYKRADLIFDDIPALARILVENNWPVNFLFAGKAHPEDEPGKSVLKLLLDCQEALFRHSNGLGKLIFIPDYDMSIAKLMVAGVHSWLNSPKRPLEASGTSGMKAAMNGVPNISVLDGWWVEGYHGGQTGWKFGYDGPVDEADLSEDPSTLLYNEDSASFYRQLPLILEAFYHRPESFLAKAVNNLKLNVPIFNTHRMTAEYIMAYDLHLDRATSAKIAQFRKLYQSDLG
ncbi:alpha-glucan family phosphorylase [Desulfogranum mediterraneum]|uniref:alpha-glucan family phosphorylase n=1 Tax=Desulfogranum mediterraneum TaxID=160661 RepID=UPI000423E185|nr:alpha-glucan family phosphorylase [Desulfogranum mediterraneum]